MSRSKQKHLFLTIGGGSNKKDRTLSNKKMRKINKILLRNCDDDTLFIDLRDVSNPWNFNTDGLARYVGTTSYRGEPFTVVEMHKFFGK